MSSHFYSPVTGELIDGGLREARKIGGLPSPTTVLGLIKGEGLIRYLQRQAWEAGVTTPRNPGEGDDDYYARCCRHADEHSKGAREKGGDFHSLIQRFHMSCMGQADPPVIPGQFLWQYDQYAKWYKVYVERTLAVEACVIGQGYAGRLDHCALMKDGRVCVLDVKTQDTKGKGRFNYYPEWSYQLGAYAGALEPIQHVDALVSVVVSSSQPVVLEAFTWPKPPAYYHQLFLGLLAIWMESNKYWPDPIAKPQKAYEQRLLQPRAL